MPIIIYKAQPIGIYEAKDLLIEAREPLPEVASLAEASSNFKQQASVIAEALWSSLPGGTLDALLIEFLERKRSLFVVNPKTFKEANKCQ